MLCRGRFQLIFSKSVFCVAFLAVASAPFAFTADEAAPAEPKPPVTIGVQRDEKAPKSLLIETEKLSPESPFTDPRMGVAFTVPQGFTRLNEEEYRAVVNRLSEQLGKEAGERMMRQAAVHFVGPTKDGKLPPSMTVSISAGGEKLVPEKLDDYRDRIRISLERNKQRFGTISAKLIKVGNQYALRADHELFSIEDNSRQNVTMLLVPGGDRQCDIVFNYSKGQEALIDRAFDKVVETFKFVEGTPRSAATRDWGRVFLWTGGAFVFGIALSFVLRALNKGAKPVSPEEAKK